MISSTMNVTVPKHFWEPLRQRLVLNTISYLPFLNAAGAVLSNPKSPLPIVTYISRQGGGRRLTDESHDGLVKSLKEMENEGLYELHIVRMETMSFSQQVEAVARSTVSRPVGCFFLPVYTHLSSKIILGVHGNGLTVSSNPFFWYLPLYMLECSISYGCHLRLIQLLLRCSSQAVTILSAHTL